MTAQEREIDPHEARQIQAAADAFRHLWSTGGLPEKYLRSILGEPTQSVDANGSARPSGGASKPISTFTFDP